MTIKFGLPVFVLSVATALAQQLPELPPNCVADTPYDFIVVGSGPSGSVFTRRAAEQGKKVLLLERGEFGPSGGKFDTGTGGSYYNSADTRIPKMFAVNEVPFAPIETLASFENAFIGNTRTLVFQGLTTGGGSGINGMAWRRPNFDTEFTEEKGWPLDSGWTGDTFRKAFKVAESAGSVNTDGNVRGQSGPLTLEKNG